MGTGNKSLYTHSVGTEKFEQPRDTSYGKSNNIDIVSKSKNYLYQDKEKRLINVE